VGRQRADRYGRRAAEIESPGLDCQTLLLANRKLRICAVAQQIDHAEDFIAGLEPSNIGTHLLDGSTQFPA
jgi:hypothetical protein